MMDCSACGTQLPQGAANCPRCGAATPSYYSATGSAPNDPTEVPFTDAVVPPPPPPPLYGSQHQGSAPVTPYDPSPYEAAAQSPYESSPYQSPYEPYNVASIAPPLLSPQRPGKRIGLIIGVVLLVLLLLGGGVGAWLAYSAARNAAATAAVATTTAHTNATATASAVAAVQNFTAKGTATFLNTATTSVRQDGQNKVYGYRQQAVAYGDIVGSFTVEGTSIVHPDNTASLSGRDICTCTVAGKSGTLMWSYTGTQTADGSFQGQFFDLLGTGDLAKLHGQGVFQGQGSHDTYSAELHFDG